MSTYVLCRVRVDKFIHTDVNLVYVAYVNSVYIKYVNWIYIVLKLLSFSQFHIFLSYVSINFTDLSIFLSFVIGCYWRVRKRKETRRWRRLENVCKSFFLALSRFERWIRENSDGFQKQWVFKDDEYGN